MAKRKKALSADEGMSNPNRPGSGEPSLAPACGCFLIVAVVIASVAVIAVSWYLGRNQHELAARALRTQLIPWVQKSELSDFDKTSINERLEELATEASAKRLTDKQLLRLNIRLNGSPIFQWGLLENLNAAAANIPELTDAERQQLHVETDRMLLAVWEHRLVMENLEFALQSIATKEPLEGRLRLKVPITASDVQEFTRRANAINDRLQIPMKPMDKSVSQIFRLIVDDALDEPRWKPPEPSK